MELTQIRYFLAVAETLNFTAAAESCAVSQPALSKAIRKLEESLGAELFDRSSQQVALTEFGRTMRVHFERIEDSRRKAREAARIAATQRVERLDVGVMCTIGPNRFMPFLEHFRESHPHIEVVLHDVVGSRISDLLLGGGFDCAFCGRSAKHDQRFQAVELFSEPVAIAFAKGHRFEELETVPLEEIAKETYLDRLHCEFRDDFLDFTKASGMTLKVALRSEREDWILKAVEQGMGVSVMAASSVLSNFVSYRPIGDLSGTRKLEIVSTSSETHSPALTKLLDAARAFDWQQSH